jgi:putative transcriptional regulator
MPRDGAEAAMGVGGWWRGWRATAARWRVVLVVAALAAPGLPAAAPVAPSEPDQDAGSLQGQLLIATPEMGDPRFHHAVILMVRHDHSGAFGIMINRPFEVRTLASLLAAIGKPDDTVEGTLRIFAGGPVELGAGFVLHSADHRYPDTIDIDRRTAMTSSPDVLRDIGHHTGPAKALFAIGYAGWGPGQLEG